MIIFYIILIIVNFICGYGCGLLHHLVIRKSKWLEVGHDNTTYFYRCEKCGHEEHDNMTKHNKFCSHCGRFMQ